MTNFHKVTDNLYRGSQPQEADIIMLRNLGVKTIINLEEWYDFNWGEGVRAANFAYERIPCNPWHPEIEDARDFLDIVEVYAYCPAFVHCKQGSDRTGMMVAIYRIEHGWSPEKAVDEMVNGGFGFHGDLYPEIVPFVLAWK
jgi:protein tyrosine/serine phosphatase